MSSNTIYKDDKLINVFTGEVIHYKGGDNKFFAVLLKGGHCGTKYYIPIIKGIMSRDMVTASDYARQTARVKRGNKDAILGICEITMEESLLIQDINSQDKYFSTLRSNSGADSDEIERRKIIYEHHLREQLRSGKEVNFKTADQYDDDCVAERYCAPSIVGSRIIYPQNINMRQMLNEFFDEKIKIIGLGRGMVSPLCLYIQVRGEDNPLGIKYKDGSITYIDSKNIQRSVVLSESKKQYIERNLAEKRQTIKQEISFDEDYCPKAPSKVDRFRARLARTAAIQAKKESDEEVDEK